MAKDAADKLLIFAGSGTYPAYLAAGARKAGVRHISILAFRGMTDRATVALADEVVWFGIGEVQSILTWTSQQNFTCGILAGQITPLALFRTRFDSLARGWLKELPVKNAHTIYGKVATEFEKIGIRVLPASCYMDDFIPGTGVQTQRSPDEREMSDITLGHQAGRDICGLDIGQTLVLKDGMILADEAFE